jgi:hypothetical protein
MKKGSSRKRLWSHPSISRLADSPALNYALSKGRSGPGPRRWGTFALHSFVSMGTGVSAAELPFVAR